MQTSHYIYILLLAYQHSKVPAPLTKYALYLVVAGTEGAVEAEVVHMVEEGPSNTKHHMLQGENVIIFVCI